MNMRELLARKAKIAREMRELADAADGDTGALTEAQQAALFATFDASGVSLTKAA